MSLLFCSVFTSSSCILVDIVKIDLLEIQSDTRIKKTEVRKKWMRGKWPLKLGPFSWIIRNISDAQKATARLQQIITVMRIIKLKLFPVPVRLHSGYGKLIFVIISPFFAIFKNVVHSL